ncbi:MAG: tetratricopeptide repeat protein [Cyanobacteria bacterium SZAS LIN-2]|nr:tetratricopeptide repeat protein [Cyanobacteria bacterium SZAS LIN-2]
MTIEAGDQALQKAVRQLTGTDTAAADGADASRSFLAEVATSASNQGKSVYNAVGQLTEVVGVRLPEATLTEQKSAPLMSSHWWAQQAGGLAVSLPLVLLTHKGISAMTEPLAAAAMQPQKLALTRLALTGAAYEGVFKPSQDDSLLWGRAKQAAEGGAGFLAMGLASNKIGGFVGRSIEGDAVGLAGRFGRTVLPGIGGGAAYGLTEVQSKSILDRGNLAGMGASLDAISSGAVMGMTLSSVGMLNTRSELSNPAVQSMTRAGDNVLTGLKHDRTLSSSASDGLNGLSIRQVTEGVRLAKNGQHQEAVAQLQEGLANLVRVRGADHPEVAQVLSNMARSDMFLGNSARAVQSLESALKINRGAYGEKSQQVSDNYDQLSAVYLKSGDLGKAADSLGKSIDSRQGTDNMRGPAELRQSLAQLANLYEKAGDPAKAEEVRRSMPEAPAPQNLPHH